MYNKSETLGDGGGNILENNFGDIIYKARRAKGFSQEYLAGLVGVSRQTISQWENDKFQPNNDNINLLCQVLDLSREVFVGKSEVVNNDNAELKNAQRINNQKIYKILIAIISSLAVVMAILTALMAPICFTSNTGDMMDNSYSIPQYAFYVVLALTLILILIDVAIIAIMIKDKHNRS